MKKLALALALTTSLLILNSTAHAEEEETDNVCSSQNASVCAHIHFINGELKTTEEGKFIVHVDAPPSEKIAGLQAELWMPSMSHGSAPLTIKAVNKNHFSVSNAFFIMPGTWVVRLQVRLTSGVYSIEIPVEIKQ